MTSPIEMLGQNAQLAEAAYANFDSIAIPSVVNSTQVQNALEEKGFSTTKGVSIN